jgi:hypothetical protein
LLKFVKENFLMFVKNRVYDDEKNLHVCNNKHLTKI